MRMYKFSLAFFVASATYFEIFKAGNALTLDKSSRGNTRILTNLNSSSKNVGEDDSTVKLETSSLFERKNLENIEEQSNPASKGIQDPNNIKPIRRRITKRCIHPITKRRIKCPFSSFKKLIRKERSDKYLNFQNPYIKKRSLSDVRTALQNLFKSKFSRDTDYYKQRTDEENTNDNRRPDENADAVTVVVGRNIIKGRGKKKFICHCYEDNCKGKHCRLPTAERPNNYPKPIFYGPDVLHDRNNENDKIYQIGPIYDPVYYIQNIQRQQEKALMDKVASGSKPKQIANSQSFNPKSSTYFSQNPLTEYSNIAQPIYYFNTLQNKNPVSKEYPYDIVGSAKTEEDKKISINDCIRLYGRDFCVLSASTQRDSLKEHTEILKYEEPVLGVEAPDYEDDFTGEDYEEITEPSWYNPLESLESNDDTLGTFYEDENEEYYPPKSKSHDSDEVVQKKPEETIGKAIEVSSNSRFRTMSSTVRSELSTENQSEEILGSANLGVIEFGNVESEAKTDTSNSDVNLESEEFLGSVNNGVPESENILTENPINDESDEILGSTNVGQQFPPNINIELKEKAIEPVSKELFAGIPSVLGKVCTIETKKSFEVTKDKTCLTENKQYTFSNEEKSSTKDHMIGTKQKEVDTSSDLSIEQQEILQSAIITVLNNFDPKTKFTEEEIVGSTKDSTLPPILGIPIIRNMFGNPQVENMITDSVRGILSIIPGGNWIGGITDKNIKSGLRNLIKNIPVQDDFSIRDGNSPIEVEEHKVKDGEWYTETVTIFPVDPQVGSSQPPERVLDEVENIVSSPELGRHVVQEPILQNIIMQTVKNTLKSDTTLSRQMINLPNIQNAMNIALGSLSAMPSGTRKASASPNKPISANINKNLPSGTVTERTFKSGQWGVKTTKLGEESNERFVGAAESEDSEEEIISDSVSGETPAIPKYETGAAKKVTTSARARPTTTMSSIESSLEAGNPIASSESDDHEIDADSKESVENTPIKYYSPQDRVLNYKKNHQKDYQWRVKQSESTESVDSIQEEKKRGNADSDIPESRPRSKVPLIAQPKQFQTDKEDEILVGMVEGSGMLEEEVENEAPLANVGYFEDYESSGDRSEDNLSSDENLGSSFESNKKPYVSGTTVAENENIDDQYTGAVFTEVSEKNKKIDHYNEEIMDSQYEIKEDSMVDSVRNFETVTNRTLDVRTPYPNNNDYNQLDGLDRNFETETDRITDDRTTDLNNNNYNQLVSSVSNFETVMDRTPDDITPDPNKNDYNQVIGSVRNFKTVTDRTPDVRTTDSNNNDYNQLVGSFRIFETVTEKTPEDIAPDLNNNDYNQLVGSVRNFKTVADKTPDVRTTDRNNNNYNQFVESSRKKIYEGSSRTSQGDYYSKYQEADAGFEKDSKYVKYEKGIMGNDPLLGKAKNDEDSFYSQEIYYIPKTSELEDEDTELRATNSNYHGNPTYLGKLLPQYRNKPRDSENSDLMYIGDGVRLPLKVIKLNDGSFSLALSDRICNHLLKMNCPCYVQRNQPVVNERDNADEESSRKEDDEERDFKDYSFRKDSKQAERGKTETSVDYTRRRLPKVSSKQSKGGRTDKKREDEHYKNYVQTLLDVNDIPEKHRAGFVTNALDRVVNDDVFTMKEKVQIKNNKQNFGNHKYRRYDTSRRVEMLKVFLSWVKDLIFTATHIKS